MVNKKLRALHRGFTLIESVISIGVISILLPVIFGLFFISLQSELKIRVLKTVKNSGDLALTYISDTIRENAFSSISCTAPTKTDLSASVPYSGPSSACFRTKDDKCFEIFVDGNVAAKTTSLKMQNLTGISGCTDFFTTSPIILTNNSDVYIEGVNIFNVEVPVSIFRTGSVTISYVITSKKDNETSLNYYSKAKIRNY